MTNMEMKFYSFKFFNFLFPAFCSLAIAHRVLKGSVLGSVLPVTAAVGQSACEEATGFYETL